MDSLRLVFTHYKSFVVASGIITLSMVSAVYLNGFDALSAVVLFKIVTTALIIIFINIYKKKEFYYYQNLGFSKTKIWIYTIGIDFILFMLFVGLSLFYR